MKHAAQYNGWSWIVSAIEAIERCGKARRFAYCVLGTVALWGLPALIDALARAFAR
jgi:hypothetical protein